VDASPRWTLNETMEKYRGQKKLRNLGMKRNPSTNILPYLSHTYKSQCRIPCVMTQYDKYCYKPFFSTDGPPKNSLLMRGTPISVDVSLMTV
jgi:hypothetical protein